MSDNFFIKFTPGNEGVRRFAGESSEKPAAGSVGSPSNFKRILDSDSERKSGSNKISVKKDSSHGDDDKVVDHDKAPVSRKEDDESGEEKDLFSLLTPKKAEPEQPKQLAFKSDAVKVKPEDETFGEDSEALSALEESSGKWGAEKLEHPKFTHAKAKSATDEEVAEIDGQEETGQSYVDLGQSESKPKALLHDEASGRADADREGRLRSGLEESKDLPADKLAAQAELSREIAGQKAHAAEMALLAQKKGPQQPIKESTNIFEMSAVQKGLAGKAIPKESSELLAASLNKSKAPEEALRAETINQQRRSQLVSEAAEGLAGQQGVAQSEVNSRKENVANPFPQEQLDLSAVNPQALVTPVAQIQGVASTVDTARAMPIPAQMQALIDQLAKEISVMTIGDKTETTITLRHPPLFAEAQVMITGYQSARGELNITFANLTQNAQQILEQQQTSLLAALETKGYFVHIFTATTSELQTPIATAGQQADRERPQDQGKKQQSQDQQQKHS